MNEKTIRVAIVAADFNKNIVDGMIDVATQELQQGQAVLVRVVRVAGSYEMPIVADIQMAEEGVDALVILGYIERGETLHGEVMGHVVLSALINLQLKHRKPMGLGIIGPGATEEQAAKRKTEYAKAAVRAVLRSCELMPSVHE